jgi:ABC-type antimicrobial peptide transport system permease subunit
VGLYSVVSYTVAQRTNEFGIRMALGAQSSDVLRMVVQSTTASVGMGLVVGVVLSVALNRMIIQWAQDSPITVSVLVVVSVVLAGVAAMACLLPARHASTIDPMKALRYE